MTTIERMKKERDRLLQEAKEIDKAIAIMNRFKEKDAPAAKIEKPHNRSTTKGGGAVVLACAKELLIKTGRPLTREEILAHLPTKGYTRKDINVKNFSSYLSPHICGEGRGKANSTYWWKDRPRPEKEEWKGTLESLVDGRNTFLSQKKGV